MARPKRQDERRNGIRAAARRAIAARGYGAVRIKDIASEAGLSSQSILYYYPDVGELLVETIAHAVTRFVEQRREAADRLDDPVLQLAATIGAGFPRTPEDDTTIIFESAGAFRHDAALRAMVRSLNAQQVEMYRRILDVGASRGAFRLSDDSLGIATNLVALEDAYSLYILEGGPPSVEEAVRLVAAYASLATGVEIPVDVGPSGTQPGVPG
ncbi:MAG: TetR/AcrR family transcriptional regulator [Acidobacteriota bacterium]|nr:TetR/AcrR family transcriptional regulator [Acidobacteriota bacterium]